MKPVKQPKLIDLIFDWIKKELPKAKFEERDNLQTLMPKIQRVTIMKRWGRKKDQIRECFHLDFQKGPFDSYVTIGTNWSSTLSEEITVKADRVIFGKWGGGIEILAADPEFFGKLALYMTQSARVVTMGDFSPNLPEPDEETA